MSNSRRLFFKTLKGDYLRLDNVEMFYVNPVEENEFQIIARFKNGDWLPVADNVKTREEAVKILYDYMEKEDEP